jgi:hypothetical protein
MRRNSSWTLIPSAAVVCVVCVVMGGHAFALHAHHPPKPKLALLRQRVNCSDIVASVTEANAIPVGAGESPGPVQIRQAPLAETPPPRTQSTLIVLPF